MFKTFARKYLQGRIVDTKVWGQKIENVCRKWLVKTPVVPENDGKRLCRKKGKKSIQVWQVGSLIIALNELGIKLSTDKIKRDFDLSKITDSDYGMLAFALLNENNLPDASGMLDYVKSNQNGEGIILYKNNVKNMCFVDTLGFTCPFLVKYGVLTGDESYIAVAEKQINWYIENGVERHCNLPFHAVSENKTTLGICDWARGTAWLLIALMDGYKVLQLAGKDSGFLKENILNYANILVELQKSSGAYSWQLLSANKDSDSSATAVIGWFLANAFGIFGDKKYLDAAEKCRKYLMSITFNNGVIDYCQGDTLSIGVYSRIFDKMPFGQAFALRLQTEMNKYD